MSTARRRTLNRLNAKAYRDRRRRIFERITTENKQMRQQLGALRSSVRERAQVMARTYIVKFEQQSGHDQPLATQFAEAQARLLATEQQVDDLKHHNQDLHHALVYAVKAEQSNTEVWVRMQERLQDLEDQVTHLENTNEHQSYYIRQLESENTLMCP